MALADPPAADASHRTGARAPLTPADRLSVGVIGHRLDRLGRDRVELVEAAVDRVLEVIEQAAPLPQEALRLVTGLADGADAIGADAALARGWRLDVVLPFDRETYAADFGADERKAYVQRLAASAAIMELPGDRDAPDGEGVAYERAGRVTLLQSDLVIAVWDGAPARGRGGGPQIVAEAVAQGIPVVHIDPAGARPPLLLWSGLEELDLGRQTVETVARGDLGALAGLVRQLLAGALDEERRAAAARFAAHRPRRLTLALAYPMLLAVMGVRRLRFTDVHAPAEAFASDPCPTDTAVKQRIATVLQPRFAHADRAASRFAQLFRSVYVTNFALAALAVVASMLGLALPASAKPALIAIELAIISVILVQTRAGRRASWHRLWLDNRALAERLRCLEVTAQLGDLQLRGAGEGRADWVESYARATAQEIGLPAARIDAAYLRCVREDLMRLVGEQVGYLEAEAARMHRLEHRMHLLGTVLFALTALTCVVTLAFKTADALVPTLSPLAAGMGIGSTIVSAALPAIGAAIYGMRMQGDYAGAAERSRALGDQLARLGGVIAADALDFDTLSRRARRVTELLTEDVASWLQAYHARPLTLPG